MNKSELVDAIASEAGLTKDQAAKSVNAFISSVQGALERGDDVVLVGFGTFSVKERAARTGRNPKTGEPLQIAASKVPSFKAGKGLKDAVNATEKTAKKGKK
ncbi:HU family DNA-binding protein [Moraxella nonliquefaciens]|uniref:HU family DNA-binding protein n=1 Tax=Moraxella nonliquefaciens TaxID=478 RepID=UPI001EF552A4|nr:HU family DNA-binding protein [Moraxella nonliquefaciens]MCG7410969.1 HU family DNA-binding protein [Moraxella nonliquefaciens]